MRIVIIGAGPAGYEAALVAAQYGAEVTLVETDGAGGNCVLYDCVPSKTFIASAGGRTAVREADQLGIQVSINEVDVDIARVHARVSALAMAQSNDIRSGLLAAGVTMLSGHARFVDESTGLALHNVEVTALDGSIINLQAEAVLIATGASPRVLPTAIPDGERILTWRQVYSLSELPEHLIIVGSGVTGAEFASAYTELGVRVTLVSSRDRVLPHEDADAAAVIEEVFDNRGVTLVKHARADLVEREGDQVRVTLADGRKIVGSHCLMTVGSVPNTVDLGLEKVGIVTGPGGFIPVDRVSRTSVAGIYAAGDCTGVLMLASVAAMQGRIAMWHFLGDGVPPLRLKTVSANVFTHPEIATVGISQAEADAGLVPCRVLMLPLATNPRAKMLGLRYGFVKIFVRPATGIVVGGVVVGPEASELILPMALAVQNRLTAKNLAYTFSVYPSLTGSITELGRQLMHFDGDLG
ncbi:NAD(P)H-quinone dehydrogenase [Nakamurella antarctica]|uniref:NAD(P)H-quinone dehydrogenase n=1 Tax=Nakamurella antarctica TaxID=1902245 RepID=A0A3G8ZVR7_9ACTN|nr:NAD(P)H-quinone dehydrogenase [Nakamurella antarctica]AZI58554.1 NAD(P)H-quinone dehydrogenase [Nakamurella antarctica]